MMEYTKTLQECQTKMKSDAPLTPVEENKALMDNVAEKYDLFTDVLKLRAA
jgi:hypothetical protein